MHAAANSIVAIIIISSSSMQHRRLYASHSSHSSVKCSRQLSFLCSQCSANLLVIKSFFLVSDKRARYHARILWLLFCHVFQFSFI